MEQEQLAQTEVSALVERRIKAISWLQGYFMEQDEWDTLCNDLWIDVGGEA